MPENKPIILKTDKEEELNGFLPGERTVADGSSPLYHPPPPLKKKQMSQPHHL